jgi:hypothetical protein
MRKCVSLVLAAAVGAAMLAGPLFGQNEPNPPKAEPKDAKQQWDEATQASPWFWNAQLMINAYVRAMSQAYKLTDKQEEYTRELMNKRVKQFLKDYEKDSRTLLSEYFEYRMSGEVPSAQAAKEFAKRAQPLVPIIRQEIIDGNMQWRRILNEEQIKLHDRDLEIINRQFDTFDKMMTRWSDGDVRPLDVGIQQRNRPFAVRKIEDAMGDYVRNFIARYNLDESQQQTAQSILREAREEATRYRDSHKDEFTELAAKQKDLTASNPKTEEDVKRAKEEGRKLTERQAELEKPLTEELFSRFKDRLEKIPTTDQRAAYEARQTAIKERLAVLRAKATTMPTTTRPATTRPATSRPAEAATESAD